MRQMDADCIVRHMNAFLGGKRFGEPCTECEYALKECNFDWLSRLKEVRNSAKVSIQLFNQETVRKLQGIKRRK